MRTRVDEVTIAKRRLMLSDSLAILTLVLITCVLFAFTLFLFRSFTSHRAELAQRWSDRGRRALQMNRPQEAIADLRTALTYAPGTRDYELLLAQALGQAGHIDESYNYFLGLWDTQPGDGDINLNLARLAARKGKTADAINYYHAAIYGTWSGDGVARRAQVRMELARYLVAQDALQAARTELLIIGGNTPDDRDRDMILGDLLQQAGDPGAAAAFYQKAIALQPKDPQALESAARLAYAAGDYRTAHVLFQRAEGVLAQMQPRAQLNPADVELMSNAGRMLQLMPNPGAPVRERTASIVADRAIARQRFDVCSAQLGPNLPMTWQALAPRWSGPDGTSKAPALMRDPARQEAVLRLIYDTELQAQKICGAPTGDDALLLKLAFSSYGITQPDNEPAATNARPKQP
jgi:Tfp pilus assembly protein PilF